MPYAFLVAHRILMIVLMLVPIVMVIGYSVMDNVIINKNPEFVGHRQLRRRSSPTRRSGRRCGNTLVFTVVERRRPPACSASAFAMLLNTKLLGNTRQGALPGLYVLPWLFTVAIIAVLWRMLLSPNGVVNFLLTPRVIDQTSSGSSSPALALGAVTFINIWAGYPFFMVSLLAGLQGIPSDLYEAATVDGASARAAVLQRHAPAAASRSSSAWRCSTSSGRRSSSRSSG